MMTSRMLRAAMLGCTALYAAQTVPVPARADTVTLNTNMVVTQPTSRAPAPITPVFATITNFTSYTGPFPFITGTFRVGSSGLYSGTLNSPAISNGWYVLRGQFFPSTGTPSNPLSDFIVFRQALTNTQIDNIQLTAGQLYSYLFIFSTGNSAVTWTLTGPGCIVFTGFCGAFVSQGLTNGTQNQLAVANAIDRGIIAAGSSGGFGTVANLSPSQLADLLDQASGELGTAAMQAGFVSGGQFFGTVLANISRWRGGFGGSGAVAQAAQARIEVASAVAQAGVTPARGSAPVATTMPTRWGVWAQGFGGTGGIDGDAATGSARVNYGSSGAAAGFDVRVAPNAVLGFAAGASGAVARLGGRPGRTNNDGVHLAVYGGATWDALYVDAAFGYSRRAIATERTVTGLGLTEVLRGETDANQWGGRVETGWTFRFGGTELSPFLGVQALVQHTLAYAETPNAAQGSTFALTYGQQRHSSVRGFLGADFRTRVTIDPHTTLTPFLRIAYVHEFANTRSTSASFQSLPGAAFIVEGARPARDSVVIQTGAELALDPGVAVFAAFAGELSGRGNSYGAQGGLRLSW